MIILDNNILISLCVWDKNADKITEFLQSSKLPIGIPTPVMAEFCAIDHSDRSRHLVTQHKQHETLVFDGLAAIACGQMTEKLNQIARHQQTDLTPSRQKIKVDLQIVAIAMTRRASIILSNDHDIKAIITALHLPIKVYNLDDLQTEKSIGPLFQQ